MAIFMFFVIIGCIAIAFAVGYAVGQYRVDRQYVDREKEVAYQRRIEELEGTVVRLSGSPDEWDRRFNKEVSDGLLRS